MREITILGYLVCAALLAMLTVESHTAPQRIARPSALLDVVMADRAARVTILLFWWWLGWHFLVTVPGL